MRTLHVLLAAGIALAALALPTASAGGPCDRIDGPITSEQLTWTIDDRCRHDLYVDPMGDCGSTMTKVWRTEEVHPNLALHYGICQPG